MKVTLAEKIYSPVSVLNFLQYGIVRSYCRKRGRVEALDNAFRYSPIEETIRNMLGDGCIEIELVTDITVNHITKLTNLFVDKPT